MNKHGNERKIRKNRTVVNKSWQPKKKIQNECKEDAVELLSDPAPLSSIPLISWAHSSAGSEVKDLPSLLSSQITQYSQEASRESWQSYWKAKGEKNPCPRKDLITLKNFTLALFSYLSEIPVSCLACQRDKLELFLHILFLRSRLQRPELSAAIMSWGLSPHFRCTCRHRPPGHILSHQYPADRPFTKWSLHAPVAHNLEILNELPFFFPAGLLRDTRIKRKKHKHSGGVRTGKDRRPVFSLTNTSLLQTADVYPTFASVLVIKYRDWKQLSRRKCLRGLYFLVLVQRSQGKNSSS